MENIDRSEKYNIINEVLNDYLSKIEGTFFHDHIHQFLSLAIEVRKIVAENDPILQGDPRVYKILNPDCDELTEYLSWPETLQIVRDYFQQRLPQYADTFEECLNNGIINIAIDLDDPTQDIKNHAGYKACENHHYVNTKLEHNYFDPKTLVHEFIHHLNSPNADIKLTPTRKLLTETISIFFECDVLRFMQEKGYSQEEIAKVIHSRIEECYNLGCTLPLELSLLNTFKYTGNLSDKSLVEAEKLGFHRRTTQEDYLRDIDQFYEWLKKYDDPPNISVGYMLGITIALSCLAKEDPNMINKFITLNESVNSKSEIECLEIIGIDPNRSDSIREVLGNFQKSVEEIAKTLSKEDSHSKRI